MRRVRWQCMLIVLAAALLGGCALAQPGTPSATWEPLPTLDGAAGGSASVPSGSSPTDPAPTTVVQAPASTLAPTRTPLPTTVPTSLPPATWTLAPTEQPTPAASATPFATWTLAPTHTATSAPTDAPTPEPADTAAPEPTATVEPTALPVSGLVDGWVGTVEALPVDAAYDDYFAVDGTDARYGIRSLVPRIEAQLASYRGTGTRLRIWGVLDAGVSDHNDARITVTRLALVSD